MQYIMEKEEYDQMIADHEKALSGLVGVIQNLCIEVATNKKIKYWGNKDPRVWGCILIDEDHPESMEYCDECPVQNVCPNPQKQWSK